MSLSDLGLALLFFAVALLYATAGHAGASGYLAAMALWGTPAGQMAPTALVLNLFVGAVATFQYWRAGCFSWSLFWPFALASIPAAYLGGVLEVPAYIYKPLVAAVLFFAAGRILFLNRKQMTEDQVRPPSMLVRLVAGLLLGLLAGLTGTGGGIFLSPLLILSGWATLRQTAGVSAAFILVNSAAGLLGQREKLAELSAALPLWVGAVLVGGIIGAWLGSRLFQSLALRRCLAVVLIIAAAKLLLPETKKNSEPPRAATQVQTRDYGNS